MSTTKIRPSAYILLEQRKQSFGVATEIVAVYLDPITAAVELDKKPKHRQVLIAPLYPAKTKSLQPERSF